jgi:hypothetical protein
MTQKADRANDGLADGVIDDPRKSSYDVRALQCAVAMDGAIKR